MSWTATKQRLIWAINGASPHRPPRFRARCFSRCYGPVIYWCCSATRRVLSTGERCPRHGHP